MSASTTDLAEHFAPSEIVERRDRDGHAIALVFLDQPNTSSRVPSATRCRICGEEFGTRRGASRLDHHYRASEECRQAIVDWLEARREARTTGGEMDG